MRLRRSSCSLSTYWLAAELPRKSSGIGTGNFGVRPWLGITSGSTSSVSMTGESPCPVMPTIDGELMPRELLVPSEGGKLFCRSSTVRVVVFNCPLAVEFTDTDECLESLVPIFCSSGEAGGRNLDKQREESNRGFQLPAPMHPYLLAFWRLRL